MCLCVRAHACPHILRLPLSVALNLTGINVRLWDKQPPTCFNWSARPAWGCLLKKKLTRVCIIYRNTLIVCWYWRWFIGGCTEATVYYCFNPACSGSLLCWGLLKSLLKVKAAINSWLMAISLCPWPLFCRLLPLLLFFFTEVQHIED